MRVLITGSRQFIQRQIVYAELGKLWDKAAENGEVDFTVVHGNAMGADTLANEWCWDNRLGEPNVIAEPHPVNWRPLGYYDAYAGKARNIEMLRTAPDYILAFFTIGAENRGTHHCVESARTWARDVPLQEFWA